jgi:hypothetical protein
MVSIRALTKGPGYHWFGYYDKRQFSPDGRYILGMQADFEHRRPKPDDRIKIGMVDTEDSDRWIELGQSSAWCWQMGCMLQWRPGSESEVMWNDREGDSFVSHILNIKTLSRRTLPFPFFCVHPGGELALGLDFERLEYMRPGYGYAGIEDCNKNILAPDEMGIYLLDLKNAGKKLIIPLSELSLIPDPTRNLSQAKHYCNCLLFNPSGTRFVFLHRWRPDQGAGWPFKTRMFSSDLNGKNLFILVPGGCGHFNWRDEETLIVQDGGFSLYRDCIGKVEQVGKGIIPDSGGHVSYLPQRQWLVGDTYPDARRLQKLYLFHVGFEKIIDIGHFELPAEYCGSKSNNCDDEWRCDLHPRISPDGQKITIDSAHGGNGRQIYLIDISRVIK